jgi:hypothetical protein
MGAAVHMGFRATVSTTSGHSAVPPECRRTWKSPRRLLGFLAARWGHARREWFAALRTGPPTLLVIRGASGRREAGVPPEVTILANGLVIEVPVAEVIPARC